MHPLTVELQCYEANKGATFSEGWAVPASLQPLAVCFKVQLPQTLTGPFKGKDWAGKVHCPMQLLVRVDEHHTLKQFIVSYQPCWLRRSAFISLLSELWLLRLAWLLAGGSTLTQQRGWLAGVPGVPGGLAACGRGPGTAACQLQRHNSSEEPGEAGVAGRCGCCRPCTAAPVWG